MAAATGANVAATGTPTISGTAEVGQVLTAGPGTIADANGLTSPTYRYQWLRAETASGAGTAITGATGRTYTLADTDVGKYLRVRLSFTDDASNPESRTSRATVEVVATATRQQPTLTIDVDPNRFSEDAGTVIICVVPSAVSSQRITVHAATADGTATATGDYGSYSGTVALQPQQQQACFTVTLVDDTDYEGDEDFTVTLSDPVNATLGTPAVATFIIEDNEVERDVLVAFYNATGGANWTFNTNWLGDEPLSEWRGVTTNDDGRVTELDLRNNQLTGEIPEELAQLTQLRHLYLFGNQLRGAIPVELAQLPQLRHLYLFGNQLRGAIPVELAQLTQLRNLYLFGNQLQGAIPEELAQLSQLETLALGSNQLTGEIPVELSQLAQLQDLDLSDNPLTGEIPVELAQLPQLRHLDLSSNQLTGEIPSWLVRLTELRELALWGNQLTGTIPPEVAPAQDRAVLRVFYNATGGANWADNTAWLSNAPLSAWHGVITDANGRVTSLSLSANGLTGTIPPELENLDQLQVFDIRNTGLCVTAGSELHT